MNGMPGSVWQGREECHQCVDRILLQACTILLFYGVTLVGAFWSISLIGSVPFCARVITDQGNT